MHPGGRVSASKVIDQLAISSHQAIQYKLRINVLEEDPNSEKLGKQRLSIRSSELVRRLLSERGRDRKIPYEPYGKWYGPHWVLTELADLYYPPRDESLLPLRAQEYEWLFSDSHLKTAPFSKSHTGTVFSPDRPRIHASMEGNGAFSLLRLGLNDDRTDQLVDRLLKTQWPDGGWNCDRRPLPANPVISSFHETITPLRALALHAKITKSPRSREAAKRAAEIFLKRRIFKRQSDGKIMEGSFTKLHYPPYWHYDVLFGLKVMAEAGFIKDKRCEDALDLLESKRLKDGGFSAEARYYHTSKKHRTGLSLVNWGGVSTTHMNEFVTVDALSVLKAAGRL
jgi:hypothetical protein